MVKKKRQVSAASSSDEEEEEDLELVLNKLSKKAADTRRPADASELSLKEPAERPSPRVNAIWVANPLVEEEVLLFGGECFDGRRCIFFSDTFLFDVQTRGWTRLNPPTHPSPRSAHQAIMLPGSSRLLVFGGEFGSSKETKFLHFGDTWLFDFATSSWQALSLHTHPPSRSGHRLAAIGNHIFLFGGFQDVGNQAKYLDDLWIFDANQLTWQRVDWMNEWESRPAARSGFTWISSPHKRGEEEGILLYGGYTQVKDKKGNWRGQVMNDLWLLRMDFGDPRTLRWKKLKLTPGAPILRSGSSSVAISDQDGFYNFGGVIDEEVSEEFLLGICVNDLYQYERSDGSWKHLDLEYPARLGGRFNSMLAPYGKKGILLFGGIYEAGDQQFTLDDMYLVDPASGKVSTLQELSPELVGCWKHKPTVPASESEDDSSESSNSDTTETNETDEAHSESDDESNNAGIPRAHRYATLKDFFDAHQTYWIEEATQRSIGEEVTDKQLRSAAFLLAKKAWEDSQALEKNISLE